MITSINRLMELGPKFLYLPHFGTVAANQQSITALVELIEEHGRCAEVEAEFDHDATAARLLDVLYESYQSFGGITLNKKEFYIFLGGDIEINVQGIAARRARRLKTQQLKWLLEKRTPISRMTVRGYLKVGGS